jgi:hypothetical protein
MECADTYCVSSNGGIQNATALVNLEGYLEHGDEFSMTVSGYNAAQRADAALSFAVSPRVLVDLTKPTAGVVNDVKPCPVDETDCDLLRGSGPAVIEHLLPTASVAARWDAFVDPESGVVAYEYCVGSSKLACDLADMAVVINATTVQASLSSTPAHGSTLCVLVQAVNGKLIIHTHGRHMVALPGRYANILHIHCRHTVCITIHTHMCLCNRSRRRPPL